MAHEAGYEELATDLAAATLSKGNEGPPGKNEEGAVCLKAQHLLGATAKGAAANDGAKGATCVERIQTPPLAYGYSEP